MTSIRDSDRVAPNRRNPVNQPPSVPWYRHRGLRTAGATAAKLAVSTGLFLFLVTGMDRHELRTVFTGIELHQYLLAVLLFVLSNCLGALQWYLLLRAQGLAVRLSQALVLYFVGIFFNNVLLGNIGGDAVRMYDIHRLTGRSSAGVAATVMDRFTGLFATCTLALMAYPLVHAAGPSWVLTVLAPVWLGLVAVLTMSLSRRAGGLVETIICRVVPAIASRHIRSLRAALMVYRHYKRWLAVILLLSLTVQLCRILVYYKAGHAVGMDPGLVYYVCFQPVAAIVAALPISIGGLGVREGTLLAMFTSIGVAGNLALAMSVAGYTAGILASLIGGVAFVLRRIRQQPTQPTAGCDDHPGE